MPIPFVLPMPPLGVARFEPLLAHEASYLAASAKMVSLRRSSTTLELATKALARKLV